MHSSGRAYPTSAHVRHRSCRSLGGGTQAKTPLALVVDGPVPIRALPRSRYRCSSRRGSHFGLDFLSPPGAGEKGGP
jgi:hypothetical protein